MMGKKYYIFCFDGEEFKKKLSKIEIETDMSHLLEVDYNSGLGMLIRKKSLEDIKEVGK